jgi:hypothetical protein
VLLHIAEIQQWRDFYEKDNKIAEEQRREYYTIYLATAKDKSMNKVDRKELEKKYKVCGDKRK